MKISLAKLPKKKYAEELSQKMQGKNERKQKSEFFIRRIMEKS